MGNLVKEHCLDCTHLSIQQDGEEYTIGDPVIGEFIRVPEVAADVVRGFDGEKTIEEVKESVEAKYGEEVDVLDFAETLLEMGLILKINGVLLNEEVDREVNPGLQKAGSILFSKPFMVLYTLSAIAAIFLIAYSPSLFPSFRDVFLFESVGLSAMMILITISATTIIHEFAHVLAANRLGVKTKVQLNLRMVFLVAETDMSGLWSRAKKERYTPYLAGMAWDGVMILTCLLIKLFVPIAFIASFAQMVTFFLLFGVISQFVIFLRTDMYFVLINWVNTSALHEHSLVFLQKIFLSKRQDEWKRLAPHEKKHAKWFSLLYMFGGAVATFLFVYFQILPSLYGLQQAYENITQHALTNLYFWDGILVVVALLIQVGAWLIGLRTARNERQANQAVSA